MSTNNKDNISQIWDDLDQMRRPKSRLAGVFDQLKPAKEEGLLVSHPVRINKEQAQTADKK